MVHSHQIHPVLHITQIHNRIILFPLWDLEWKCRSILLLNACDLPIFAPYRVAGGRNLGWIGIDGDMFHWLSTAIFCLGSRKFGRLGFEVSWALATVSWLVICLTKCLIYIHDETICILTVDLLQHDSRVSNNHTCFPNQNESVHSHVEHSNWY